MITTRTIIITSTVLSNQSTNHIIFSSLHFTITAFTITSLITTTINMQFLTVSIAATLLALTSAAPTTVTERANHPCPGQDYITPAWGCSSGFIGCVPQSISTSVCTGPKRFFNDCSGAAGLGSFFRCADANNVVTFQGCSTNSNICNTVTGSGAQAPQPPQPQPPKPEQPKPEPPKPEQPAAAAPKWSCPAGTWYVPKGACSSGFFGCTADSSSFCAGPQKYWSTCPPNHGNFYNCANGFIGCTTNARICG